MALPLTNLTLHCDASDTDQLFTTYNGGGAHSGTPSDGDPVEVWDDEGDGISDVSVEYATIVAVSPLYRAPGSALIKSGLSELHFINADVDMMQVYTQNGSAPIPASSLISAGAGTIACVFYPDTINLGNAAPHENHGLIADRGNWFGLHLKNDSGTRKVLAYNWDGNADVVELTVALNRVWIALWVHGSGTLTLYLIDDTGAEVSANVGSGNTTDLTGGVRIGAGGDSTATFGGRMGEFTTYNAELTGTDLADLKNYFKDKWLTLAAASTPYTWLPQVRSQTGRMTVIPSGIMR